MSLAKKLITMVNYLIPKTNIVLLSSFPAFSDNAQALYIYLQQERPDICERYRLVWAQNEMEQVQAVELQKKGCFVKKNSLKGIWYFLRARYVISTHNYFSNVRSPRGQYQINLWHGCGYKAITKADRCYRGDYTLATGDIYRSIQSSELGIPETNVWVTGFPRNDILFRPACSLEQLGIRKSEYQKVLIWMPTFRKAKFGHEELDGSEDSFSLSSMTSKEIEELDRVLQDEGFLLLVKQHPMDATSFERTEGLAHIRCITNEDMVRKNIPLYELLAQTDVLLSDYSSVIVDYLLLDKPIAMVLSDMESYRSSRGFVFENVEEYLPGPIITDLPGLRDYLRRMGQINAEWEQKRMELKGCFHKYWDDGSCRRVAEEIFRLDK